jgi:hypothetical protein
LGTLFYEFECTCVWEIPFPDCEENNLVWGVHVRCISPPGESGLNVSDLSSGASLDTQPVLMATLLQMFMEAGIIASL